MGPFSLTTNQKLRKRILNFSQKHTHTDQHQLDQVSIPLRRLRYHCPADVHLLLFYYRLVIIPRNGVVSVNVKVIPAEGDDFKCFVMAASIYLR